MAYLHFAPISYILAFLAIVYRSLAAVLPVRDNTITLPPGVTYNPQTNVWCTPTTWTDVASFFLGNYISHAATVISFPGEPVSVTVANMVLSIFFPSSGAGRGVLAILRHAAFYKDPIQQALRSRALCMVVRSPDWKPASGETLRSLSFLSKELRDETGEKYEAYKLMSGCLHFAYSAHKNEEVEQYVKELEAYHDPIELKVESPTWLERGANSTRLEIVGPNYQVFGTYQLPEGYELAYVPANAIIESISPSNDSSDHKPYPKSDFKLSSVYSFSSALISIIQIIYALTGLYRSRGDQVTKYGYAAFSFTVLPYVIMSFVNLLGNLVTPRYSTLYLIRTEMMDEASRRGGYLCVLSDTEESPQELWELQLADKIYRAGDVEPISAESKESISNANEEQIQIDMTVSHTLDKVLSTREKEVTNQVESSNSRDINKKHSKKADQKPLLICPNCYQFRTIEERPNKFLSLTNPKQYNLVGWWFVMATRVCIAAAPLAVIGGMSQFKIGSSTVPQRAWTMTWLAVGMGVPFQPQLSLIIVRAFSGLVQSGIKMYRKEADARGKKAFWDYVIECSGYILCVAVFGAPAVGGFVVVTQMLRESASSGHDTERASSLKRIKIFLYTNFQHAIMPPICTRSIQNFSIQEGKILLAISDLRNRRIRSVREAVRIYNVSRTTLQRRLAGIQYRGISSKNGFLTLINVDYLPGHLSYKIWRICFFPSMAINIHSEVKLRFSRRYNYERAKCEDFKIIQEHSDRVRDVVQEYGILPEDIYNFDETGFAMGLCASAKLITGSDRYGRPYLLQPGNREWVTAIEAVNSTGWALPSYVIFKATTFYQQGWFETLPQDWRLDISKNGWTTDDIGIRWLQKHFIPHTTSRTKGRYRMLILDGHGSHLTPQFDQICTENNIIPVCMPPRSSHLLQPLDVSCFAVLKRQYGRLVEQRVRLGFNHIDKYDFLTAFPEARTMAYKAENIQNGFKATGLVPFDPDRVYQKLTVQLRTPTPPPSRSSNSQSSCQQTPQNPRQFNRQTATIKKRINEPTTGPFEVVDQAINRLSKAYEMSRNELLIIQKEVHDLRAANEKEKQKPRQAAAPGAQKRLTMPQFAIVSGF
ncbi:pogo transposable element, putative [Talaromyces stipitatus ATCC 10500]|uniref:Pogo transposable element, putative n=1 Tax=Talaromyces stipitatus (strain ATCC 10500 / CBS 375.48 / QM 6759 / NRRL 1006) TaxID=441959 RepID=B8MJR4_TALSN|nr:pogo transposable element, putative [Talaromyces stipitatus ATCC 10500]EED14731.1 pogo transposable element, putative [Talaromyces stipitatus ATCC 10500]